jgi:hypothetical protein
MAEGPRPVLRTVLAAIALSAALFPMPLALGADPPHYLKKADWQETMIASREALVRQEAQATGAPPSVYYVSPVIRGGGPVIFHPTRGRQEADRAR